MSAAAGQVTPLWLLLLLTPAASGGALTAVAGLHRLQFQGDAYVHSPLMAAEIGFVLLTVVLLFAQPFVWLGLVLTGRWRLLLVAVAGAVLAAILLAAGFVIDMPFLMYGT